MGSHGDPARPGRAVSIRRRSSSARSPTLLARRCGLVNPSTDLRERDRAARGAGAGRGDRRSRRRSRPAARRASTVSAAMRASTSASLVRARSRRPGRGPRCRPSSSSSSISARVKPSRCAALITRKRGERVLVVLAVTAERAGRRGQQAAPLVVAHGLHVHPGRRGQPARPHRPSPEQRGGVPAGAARRAPPPGRPGPGHRDRSGRPAAAHLEREERAAGGLTRGRAPAPARSCPRCRPARAAARWRRGAPPGAVLRNSSSNSANRNGCCSVGSVHAAGTHPSIGHLLRSDPLIRR